MIVMGSQFRPPDATPISASGKRCFVSSRLVTISIGIHGSESSGQPKGWPMSWMTMGFSST